MPTKVIDCPACRAKVEYQPDLLEGPLSCPECGEHLLGQRAGVQPRPDRPQDVRRPAPDRGRDGDRERDRGRDRGRDDRWEQQPRSKTPWILFISIGAVLLAFVGIGVTAYVIVSGKRQRQVSANNLKQIGLATHSYHDANGFMPANVTSRDGKPLLSWRVALLPYVEQDNLYRRFHLDEPWDSPHNIQLLKHVPRVYVVPGREKEAAEGLTFYQGFAGPGTVFDPKPGHRLSLMGITDGTSNTILAAEAADPVPWTKPVDMPYDPAGPLPLLGGHHRGGGLVILCDGSYRFMPDRTPETTWRAMITCNGNEVVPMR